MITLDPWAVAVAIAAAIFIIGRQFQILSSLRAIVADHEYRLRSLEQAGGPSSSAHFPKLTP